MATIAIVLLTARTIPERERYATETLTTTLRHLRTTHELRLHIADDGSEAGYTMRLASIAKLIKPEMPLTFSNSGLTGYGSNYNLAMQEVHKWADYVLPLEDDWSMNRPDGFDIDPIIRVLNDNVFDSVRLGYIGYTQSLFAEFIYCNDLHWLRLDPDLSHEPHVFSGHPRLETVAYEKRVGPWPTGLTPGATEWHVATQMPESRKRIAWPLGLAGDVKNGPFAHIGTVKSYS